MIIDVHTHLFPPSIAADRDHYLDADPTFRELYASPKARLVTAADLETSMNAAGVDVSVALGFAWHAAAACSLHNDYLIEAAAGSDGRILPFCTLPLAAGFVAVEAEMRRCAALGVAGFGELRPDNHGFDVSGSDGRRLGRVAAELGSILLFHATEPAGHQYPGKAGMAVSALYQFIAANSEVRVIAAHWGGGLPFYALMPEVREALAGVSFDTAATSLLYAADIYAGVSKLTGSASILFGSDFPLLSQKRSRERIEQAGLSDDDTAGILGGNAARLLGVSVPQ